MNIKTIKKIGLMLSLPFLVGCEKTSYFQERIETKLATCNSFEDSVTVLYDAFNKSVNETERIKSIFVRPENIKLLSDKSRDFDYIASELINLNPNRIIHKDGLKYDIITDVYGNVVKWYFLFLQMEISNTFSINYLKDINTEEKYKKKNHEAVIVQKFLNAAEIVKGKNEDYYIRYTQPMVDFYQSYTCFEKNLEGLVELETEYMERLKNDAENPFKYSEKQERLEEIVKMNEEFISCFGDSNHGYEIKYKNGDSYSLVGTLYANLATYCYRFSLECDNPEFLEKYKKYIEILKKDYPPIYEHLKENSSEE